MHLFNNEFFMSWQFEGEIKARRYVPRIFVTSGSRRESPVKNSSVPGALSESSGLSLRRCLSLLSLSLSLSLSSLSFSFVDVREAATSSTSVFYPPAFQRPTYLRASWSCMYVHVYTSLSALVISATFYRRQLLNWAPRRDQQRNFRQVSSG